MSHVTNFALQMPSTAARLLSNTVHSITRWPRRHQRTSYAIDRGATTYILSRSQKLVAVAVTLPFLLMMVLDVGLLRKAPPASSPSGPPLAVNTSHQAANSQTIPSSNSGSSSASVSTDQSRVAEPSVTNASSQTTRQPTAVTAAATAKQPTAVATTASAPTNAVNPPTTSTSPTNSSPGGNSSEPPGVLDAVQTVVQTTSQTLVGTVKGLTSFTTNLL